MTTNDYTYLLSMLQTFKYKRGRGIDTDYLSSSDSHKSNVLSLVVIGADDYTLKLTTYGVEISPKTA